ncbi:MAG: type IX secretion system protein PorQ [Flavobacteriales bacterium]|nr:type IX secretion system protein PorQ [Flavobacteriales bacterium]
MKKIFIFCIGLLLQTPIIRAQIGGNYTYTFQQLPFSARAEALGGKAYSVYDNDVSLVFQNPAMLNESMHHRASFTYVNYFKGINMGAASYARTLDKSKINVWGGVHFVNYGKFTAADETGNITGNFTAGDYAITGGASRSFGKYFNVGMNARLGFSQMADLFSMGFGVDLGAAYISKSKLFVTSVVLRNVGMQFATYSNGNREPYPFELAVAASHDFDKLPLRLTVIAHNLQKPNMSYVDSALLNQTNLAGEQTYKGPSLASKILSHFSIGAELYPFKKIISLRVGYNFQRRYELKPEMRGRVVGLSYGVGIRIHRFEINYSRAEYFITGASPNTLTLNIQLGPHQKREKKKPANLPPATN